MMEFLRLAWSFLIGVGGIGIAITIAAVVLAVLLPAFRQVAIIVAVAAAVATTAYARGRMVERAFYKSRIEREIAHAVLKGDQAREEALRKFDADEGAIDDDGFRRSE